MSPEEYEIQLYSLVFGSADGQKVLCHLLTNLGFFKENLTDEEKILNNFAKKILRFCGIYPSLTSEPFDSQEKREGIIRNLFGVKPKRKKKNE